MFLLLAIICGCGSGGSDKNNIVVIDDSGDNIFIENHISIVELDNNSEVEIIFTQEEVEGLDGSVSINFKNSPVILSYTLLETLNNGYNATIVLKDDEDDMNIEWFVDGDLIRTYGLILIGIPSNSKEIKILLSFKDGGGGKSSLTIFLQ